MQCTGVYGTVTGTVYSVLRTFQRSSNAICNTSICGGDDRISVRLVQMSPSHGSGRYPGPAHWRQYHLFGSVSVSVHGGTVGTACCRSKTSGSGSSDTTTTTATPSPYVLCTLRHLSIGPSVHREQTRVTVTIADGELLPSSELDEQPPIQCGLAQAGGTDGLMAPELCAYFQERAMPRTVASDPCG